LRNPKFIICNALCKKIDKLRADIADFYKRTKSGQIPGEQDEHIEAQVKSLISRLKPIINDAENFLANPEIDEISVMLIKSRNSYLIEELEVLNTFKKAPENFSTNVANRIEILKQEHAVYVRIAIEAGL